LPDQVFGIYAHKSNFFRSIDFPIRIEEDGVYLQQSAHEPITPRNRQCF